MQITIRYKARPWAKTFHNSTKKLIVLVLHRRAGKTVASLNHLIRECFRCQDRDQRYAYIAPTYKQAKTVAWDVLKFYASQVPHTKFNEAELRCDFPNGSRITLFGADNPDSLRGIGLWGVVFDEYSQQPSNIYSEIILPTLADHNGFCIWIGCVVGNTKVLSNTVNDIIDFKKDLKYSNLDVNLLGMDNKYHKADGFFNNGFVETKKIITDRGFTLEGSFQHRVLDGKNWRRLDELKIGDEVAIAHSMEVWGKKNLLKGFRFKKSRHANNKRRATEIPKKIDKDFAYFLGLWMAEGSIEKNIHRITITCGDDVNLGYGFHKVRDNQWRINSQELHETMDYIGMPLTTAPKKYLPNKLYEIGRENMRHFLGGYWDGDGHSKKMKKEAGFTSSSLRLIQDIQLLCSNFGAIGKIYKHITPPTKKVKKECIGYQLMFTGKDYERLIEFIKPRIARKIKKLNDTRKLKRYNSYKQKRGIYFIDKIASIEDSKAYTYDFTIPDTHSYWSNGFISHNTPKGKNDFYRIYSFCGYTEDKWIDRSDEEKKEIQSHWLRMKLGEADTGLLNKDYLERAKMNMTEDEYAQEFECSFESSLKGAYYADEISRMRSERRLKNVPHETVLGVTTAWDLGMADSTAIGFFQHIGNEIRMIDYYEDTGKGLDHYIKFVKEKPYIYDRHIAPHDIAVREFTTGKSRLEIAEELGINFEIAEKLPIQDGINAVRAIFPRLYIDEEKCGDFIDKLSQYTKEWDDKMGTFKDKPKHDFTSHSADMLRTYAVSADIVEDEEEFDENITDYG